jgi:proton-translocating NADH-quinone oxidoreductase chain N
MATEIGRVVDAGAASGSVMVLALGGLMVAVGLAFKLSAVPFHFWCPDVFEGAAAEIGGFLSVASKAAAVALLLRVCFGLGVSQTDGGAVVANLAGLGALASTRHFMVYLVGLMAAVTCTLGNLAAYGQTNMKRLLAYSTIAHAGYLMMAVAAALALVGVDPAGARDAVSAVAFYLATYLFMNLGAFAIVALLRNKLRSEEIESYAGLVRSSPGLVVATAVVLVSLIGLPPLAGFVAKFLVFSSLVQAVAAGAERPLMLVLLVVGGLNTVISLFYYLRVLKVMTFDPPSDDRVGGEFSLVSLPVSCRSSCWACSGRVCMPVHSLPAPSHPDREPSPCHLPIRSAACSTCSNLRWRCILPTPESGATPARSRSNSLSLIWSATTAAWWEGRLRNWRNAASRRLRLPIRSRSRDVTMSI